MAEKGRTPHFVALSHRGVDAFADFDQVLTVDKAVALKMPNLGGLPNGDAARAFAETISRHFGRPAFPDDLTTAVQKFRQRMLDRHGRKSPEGSAVTALLEIRLRADPDWNAGAVSVFVYFIVPEGALVGIDGSTLDDDVWEAWVKTWEGLLEPTGRIKSLQAFTTTYRELDALTYRSSDPLDVEYLSR